VGIDNYLFFNLFWIGLNNRGPIYCCYKIAHFVTGAKKPGLSFMEGDFTMPSKGMPTVPLLLCLCALVLLAPLGAQAKDKTPPQTRPAAEGKANPSSHAKKAEIVADEEKGVIRFFIKGKEAMRLDESGLHVRDGVTYGGTIGDTGPSSFDDYIAEENQAGE
jgi:hypothetical protein